MQRSPTEFDQSYYDTLKMKTSFYQLNHDEMIKKHNEMKEKLLRAKNDLGYIDDPTQLLVGMDDFFVNMGNDCVNV